MNGRALVVVIATLACSRRAPSPAACQDGEPRRAGFTGARELPVDPEDAYVAEGNVDVDGRGRGAIAFMSVRRTGDSTVSIETEAAPRRFTTQFAGGHVADPVVAWDRGGPSARLYAVWADRRSRAPDSPGGRIMFWRGGEPRALSAADEGPSAVIDKPWIAARNGAVVVTWAMNSHVRVVRSMDGGETWSAPISADRNAAFRNLARPAIDDDGNVWVAWYEAGSASRIVVARWNGERFDDAVVASGALRPAFDDPSLAATAKGGTLWIAFTSGNPATGSDVWSAVSRDQGVTWAAPVKVNDDAPCATHFHPALALDGAGRPHVAWLDNRFGAGHLMYAVSLDGVSFSANTAISDAAFPFGTARSTSKWLGDYLGIAADAAHVYAAWADPRSGRSRMYSAFMSLDN